MSDSRANAYVSSIISKVQKMVAESKRIINIAADFEKTFEKEKARWISMERGKDKDEIGKYLLRRAFNGQDTLREADKIKNDFHKIELDAYDKREIISRADGALQAKLKKVLDDAETHFRNFKRRFENSFSMV